MVLGGYSLVYKTPKRRTAYLLAVSLFFYFKTSGIFLLLLLFTICSDYFWGRKIVEATSTGKRKFYLTMSVLLNLILLCYFKYAYFFTESYNQLLETNVPFFNHFAQFSNSFFGTSFSVTKLLVPVGVSFFTFQSLSYTIDMYRKKVEPVRNVMDYGFFVCFFPHLVAGPIVKAHDFIDQIYKPYELSRRDFGMALFWILNGFCKKITADYIAVNFVDRIFDNPNYYSGPEVASGIFGYSLQIYMDFSGYTDMAIGLALILGFRLKPNFNSPYKAASTSEFWKRWHISLSSWLQEYLYFPLGGNRNGSLGSYVALGVIFIFLVLLTGELWLLYVLMVLASLLAMAALISLKIKQAINTNINLMVTMLLGGLWHGSSWLFVIWGGLNGIGLVIHKLWQKISPFKNNETWPVRVVMIAVTLTFISFTRIFFRSNDMATVQMIFERMRFHSDWSLLPQIIKGYATVFAVMAIGYIIHWIPEPAKQKYRLWFADMPHAGQIMIAVMLVFAMYQLMSGEMQPFIYFQF